MDDDLKAALIRELTTIQDTLDRLKLEEARCRGLVANLGEYHARLWRQIEQGKPEPTPPTPPARPADPVR